MSKQQNKTGKKAGKKATRNHTESALNVRQIVNYGLKLRGYTQPQRATAMRRTRDTIAMWDKKAKEAGIEQLSVQTAHDMIEEMVPVAADVVASHLKKDDYQAARDILQTHKVLRDRRELTLAGVPDTDIDSELADIAARSPEGGDTPGGEETPPD